MVVRAHRTDMIISAGKHIDDFESDGIFTRPRRDTRLDEDTITYDTASNTGPEIPLPPARSGNTGFGPAVCRVSAGDVLGHVIEHVTGHDRALPADRIGVEPNDPIETEL